MGVGVGVPLGSGVAVELGSGDAVGLGVAVESANAEGDGDAGTETVALHADKKSIAVVMLKVWIACFFMTFSMSGLLSVEVRKKTECQSRHCSRGLMLVKMPVIKDEMKIKDLSLSEFKLKTALLNVFKKRHLRDTEFWRQNPFGGQPSGDNHLSYD